jgi:hypothetical protein
MAELELMGLHSDGEHLVLVGPDGHRHRLAIDDALRTAVRRDHPRPEQARAVGELRPREIQSRLRAGERAEDIAREAGVPVEHVRRYESPVLAEQAWVAQQARAITLGRDADAPTLGDLVVDRLASRGVEPQELDWTAVRRPGESWEVVLHFRAGERDRTARWGVDVTNRALHALDDEGRWLSETELTAAHPRHVAAMGGSRVYDVEVDTRTAGVSVVEVDPDDVGGEPAERTAAASADPEGRTHTDDLLDGLRASRGVRQAIAAIEDDDEQWADPPPAHPAASAPHEYPDASVLPLHAVPPLPPGRPNGAAASPAEGHPAAAEATTDGLEDPTPAPTAQISTPPIPTAPAPTARATGEPARRTKSRSRRTSVPTWDEIVFGAKPE